MPSIGDVRLLNVAGKEKFYCLVGIGIASVVPAPDQVAKLSRGSLNSRAKYACSFVVWDASRRELCFAFFIGRGNWFNTLTPLTPRISTVRCTLLREG